MKKLQYIAILTFALVFLNFYPKVYSQKRTMDDLKVALTLKICQYINHPDISSKAFNIIIYSSENSLPEKFKSLTSNFQIKGKPIKVISNAKLDDASNVQLIYVDASNSPMVNEIWQKISKHHVLLFTEAYKTSKEIMINILPNVDKGTITFELNRANLIFEGFEIDDKIIELRGSEIDIRELYRQTKTRLDIEEAKVQSMRNKLDSQNKSIQVHDLTIAKLNKTVATLSMVLDSQTFKISYSEKLLSSLNKTSLLQKTEIVNNKSLINNQVIKISQTQNSFNQNLKKLDSLDHVITQKEKAIVNKENILKEKIQLIGYKNRLIYMQASLIVLVIIIIILLLKAYRTNKLAQKHLSQQKEELEATLDKLTTAQDQLVRSEKMASLGVLTAGIAHEINNPVNFISSGMAGLKKINSSIIELLQAYREQYKEYPENSKLIEMEDRNDLPFLIESSGTVLNNMQLGVERTVNIINSLRIFARADEEVLKTLNIHKSIDMTLTILNNQYKYKIEIIKEYGKIPPMECYPGKINQLIMNLLTNAMQAIPDKGHIWITTSLVDSNIQILIKDDGIGIPENLKSKIFDPFFTTKEVGKGTGMGLSIAFSIVEEHNGNIECWSKEGEGTEFFVILPLKHKP